MNQRMYRRLFGAIPILVLAAGFIVDSAQAGVLDRIVRKAGRVADDVPLGKIDDAVDAVDSARVGRKILDEAGALDSASRLKVARKILREALEGADSTLMKHVDQLDGPLLEASVAVAKGSRQVAKSVPDLATRGRFLREGGVDTLTTLGRYEELAADAVRFDAAARAKKLLPVPGRTSVELQDFGRFFAKEGDRAKRFWDGSVRPHWKLWLGGTALAAVMAAPDDYLDDIGNMTKEGIDKVGGALASAISKAAEGAANAVTVVLKAPVRGVASGFWSNLLGDAWGLATLALLAAVVVVTCFRSPIRHRLLSRFTECSRTPKKPHQGLEP